MRAGGSAPLLRYCGAGTALGGHRTALHRTPRAGGQRAGHDGVRRAAGRVSAAGQARPRAPPRAAAHLPRRECRAGPGAGRGGSVGWAPAGPEPCGVSRGLGDGAVASESCAPGSGGGPGAGCGPAAPCGRGSRIPSAAVAVGPRAGGSRGCSCSSCRGARAARLSSRRR